MPNMPNMPKKFAREICQQNRIACYQPSSRSLFANQTKEANHPRPPQPNKAAPSLVLSPTKKIKPTASSLRALSSLLFSLLSSPPLFSFCVRILGACQPQACANFQLISVNFSPPKFFVQFYTAWAEFLQEHCRHFHARRTCAFLWLDLTPPERRPSFTS